MPDSHFSNTPAYFKEIASGDTPSSGQVALYAKTDGFLYTKDDTGIETPMGYDSTTVNTNSANWQNTYSNFSTQSANNLSVYTNVNSNSATNWNYQGTDIKSLTGNWQNTYSNFSAQSANNLSVYTTVNSNSANWVNTNDTRLVAFAEDAGSTDTYAVTLSPAPSAYTMGAHYRFKANTANTGAATINFNSLGAKTIVKAAGGITTTLANNDIRAGQWVDLVYDGTNMQMQSTLGNAGGGGSPGGADTQVQFNDSSSFGGSSKLTFNKTDGNLSILASTSNKGIKIENTTNSQYSTINFFNDRGNIGQFLSTGSTFSNGIFQGDQVALSNYLASGFVTLVAGGVGGKINFATGGYSSADEKMRIGHGVSIGNTTDPGAGRLSVTGGIVSGGTVRLKGYTVGTLPVGTIGDIAYVTDALTPVSLADVVGGGTVVVTVFHNGTTWTVQ